MYNRLALNKKKYEIENLNNCVEALMWKWTELEEQVYKNLNEVLFKKNSIKEIKQTFHKNISLQETILKNSEIKKTLNELRIIYAEKCDYLTHLETLIDNNSQINIKVNNSDNFSINKLVNIWKAPNSAIIKTVKFQTGSRPMSNKNISLITKNQISKTLSSNCGSSENEVDFVLNTNKGETEENIIVLIKQILGEENSYKESQKT